MNMKWNASLGRRPELSIYESDARTRIEIIPKYRWMKLGAEVRCRVDEDVAILIPHRPGCAVFQLPVLHGRASLAVV